MLSTSLEKERNLIFQIHYVSAKESQIPPNFIVDDTYCYRKANESLLRNEEYQKCDVIKDLFFE